MGLVLAAGRSQTATEASWRWRGRMVATAEPGLGMCRAHRPNKSFDPALLSGRRAPGLLCFTSKPLMWQYWPDPDARHGPGSTSLLRDGGSSALSSPLLSRRGTGGSAAIPLLLLQWDAKLGERPSSPLSFIPV